MCREKKMISAGERRCGKETLQQTVVEGKYIFEVLKKRDKKASHRIVIKVRERVEERTEKQEEKKAREVTSLKPEGDDGGGKKGGQPC